MVFNKSVILENLNELSQKKENDEFSIEDKSLPSLAFRCYYQEYKNKILQNYKLQDNEKEFIAVYEFTEIEKFDVNAYENNEKTKDKLKEYISNIRRKLCD